jgi:alkanesulfonate monooxygenase SsuD/methylene tetrahydromethanopterin reductase-like flavin-dependent oxidoreductase (luciferase family)
MNETNLTFGVKTSQLGLRYDEIQDFWLAADRVPLIDHAWLWDHMLPLRGDYRAATLEAWTLLAALAGQTERVRLGVMVTSNRLRQPALLAKMAATVDQISGGRLDFGIGAGGSRPPDPAAAEIVCREYKAYGFDIVSPGEAALALDETVSIVRQLWTSPEPFDFRGRCYELEGAFCEPKPIQLPHPPILIGAAGERLTLPIVARQADVWNFAGWSAAEFRKKSRILDEHCASCGRDPTTITRSMQVLVSTDEAGSARELLLELIEAGARHLVIAPRELPLPEPEWLGEQLIAPVLDQARCSRR